MEGEPGLPQGHAKGQPRIDRAPVEPLQLLGHGVHQAIAPGPNAIDHPRKQGVEERGCPQDPIVRHHRVRVLVPQGRHRAFARDAPAEQSGMDPRAVHRIRDAARISDDREAGHRQGGQIVPIRNRAGDRLLPAADVDPEFPAEGHRRGVSVDRASRPDVHVLALREDPGVAAFVGLAHEQEEEIRIEDRHVLAAESIFVGNDLLESPNEARLAGDEARRPVRTDDDPRVHGFAVRLDPPAAVVPGDPGHPCRRPQVRPVAHGSLHDPAIEGRSVDRIPGKPRDVDPVPVGGDALRPRSPRGDPLLAGTEAVRLEAELAHALRTLDRLPDDLLLIEDRRPEARRGELPRGHAPGGARPDDDRVEHVAQGVRGGYIGLTPWPRQGIAPRGLPRARSSDTRTAGPRRPSSYRGPPPGSPPRRAAARPCPRRGPPRRRPRRTRRARSPRRIYRPYAVASAGNRPARSSPCAVVRYTYGGTPRRRAGPRCFVTSWTAVRTRRLFTVVYSERPISSTISVALASGWSRRKWRIATFCGSRTSEIGRFSGRGSSSIRS